MKKYIRPACFFLSLTLMLSMGHATPKVTVNGLFINKAILVLDGQPMMFNAGDSRQGIKLVSANEYRAILEIDGIRKTMFLDKSVAQEYAKSEQSNTKNIANSHIITVELIHQTANLATFNVDYFYDGKQGKHGRLLAKVLFKEQTVPHVSYSYAPILQGQHSTSISISMSQGAPERYQSDQLLVDFIWSEQDDSQQPSAGAKTITFLKEWQQ